ncbi:MAG: type II toxin-antitoxin system RatA family toxin [Alphaproteobacteria bacterium]|jgi:coenzyme Q-binding protein COQ10|nr:type II toxin-antitoxin system RatA family toxin [Candidatus Jidaibacter sp.]
MTVLNKEYKSQYSIEQLYNMVVDIERYPEFIPWCSSAKIIDEAETIIIADLFITFKSFTESYRSQVTLSPPQDGLAKIDVKMISGPFKHMDNAWTFESTESGTVVKFYIDFKFKSFLLEKLIGVFFTSACEKMIDAFEARAKHLYE